ncbi:hypothetical protein N658DRAFT_257039 [Parathielavia hyrcaniae]|uniref:Uncharacterized protein n=1 Tax=Parathielavia hyrcaniae TaxID=113614 RepID=A0AAN6PVR2_9PEZI|nr:hypothetical protein N658DRAFT_257039 [Parathielavia hyrcaniae]
MADRGGPDSQEACVHTNVQIQTTSASEQTQLVLSRVSAFHSATPISGGLRYFPKQQQPPPPQQQPSKSTQPPLPLSSTMPPHRNLLTGMGMGLTLLLLLFTHTQPTLALAQVSQQPTPTGLTPSQIIVIPTPGPWASAAAACQLLGGYTLYPVPASPTDPVYSVLAQQPGSVGDKYWIARRRGGSCTCLVKRWEGEGEGEVDSDLLEEAPCGEELPAFCGRA